MYVIMHGMCYYDADRDCFDGRWSQRSEFFTLETAERYAHKYKQQFGDFIRIVRV